MLTSAEFESILIVGYETRGFEIKGAWAERRQRFLAK